MLCNIDARCSHRPQARAPAAIISSGVQIGIAVTEHPTIHSSRWLVPGQAAIRHSSKKKAGSEPGFFISTNLGGSGFRMSTYQTTKALDAFIDHLIVGA